MLFGSVISANKSILANATKCNFAPRYRSTLTDVRWSAKPTTIGATPLMHRTRRAGSIPARRATSQPERQMIRKRKSRTTARGTKGATEWEKRRHSLQG